MFIGSHSHLQAHDIALLFIAFVQYTTLHKCNLISSIETPTKSLQNHFFLPKCIPKGYKCEHQTKIKDVYKFCQML